MLKPFFLLSLNFLIFVFAPEGLRIIELKFDLRPRRAAHAKAPKVLIFLSLHFAFDALARAM